jgi:hypothetical protein
MVGGAGKTGQAAADQALQLHIRFHCRSSRLAPQARDLFRPGRPAVRSAGPASGKFQGENEASFAALSFGKD